MELSEKEAMNPANRLPDPEILILEKAKSWVPVIKPAGVSSESEGMGRLLSEALQVPRGQIYPVHRLDREVSGVMVYALSKKAADSLSRAVAEHRLQKTYLALVIGAPSEPEGRWEDLLFHDQKRNKTFVVQRMRKGVKPAALRYQVLQNIPAEHPANELHQTMTLLEVHLETGRTHQIRVQCASRGLPLYGDRRYGGAGRGNISLLAWKLSFPDPDTGEAKDFTAPLPNWLKMRLAYPVE